MQEVFIVEAVRSPIGRRKGGLSRLDGTLDSYAKPTWARRAVGEGVKFCPRAGCGKSASPVR